jgi:hypothetical protein
MDPSRSQSRRLLDAAKAIATIAADYEPAGGIASDRVVAWAEQFSSDARATIVHELAAIVTETYVDKPTMRNLLRRLLDRRLLTAGDPRRELEDIQFLDIQRQGVSQSRLLDVMDAVLEERGLSRRMDGGPAKTYVYLDDAIHTGNAIRYDLTPSAGGTTPAWITNGAPSGCRLVICVVGLHRRGWDHYAWPIIHKAAADKGISVQVARHFEIAHENHYWPEVITGAGAQASAYIAWLEERRTEKQLPRRGYLRRKPCQGLCETTEGRQVLERAFLDLGADLRRSTSITNQRPLGYDTLETLGFGSPLITYRNIPNTAPLALWYGPGSLFPRA